MPAWRPLKKLLMKIRMLFSPPGREELSSLMERASPSANLGERIEWLEGLFRWMRFAAVSRHEFDPRTGQLHGVRLRFFLHLLERLPHWKQRVSLTLQSILCELSLLDLFCETGLAQRGGFLAEAWQRLILRELPSPHRDHEATQLFVRLFNEERDAIWIENLPHDVVAQSIRLICGDDQDSSPVIKHVRHEMVEALVILGAELAASGLSGDIRKRLPGSNPTSSPFLQLGQRLVIIAQGFEQGGDPFANRPGEGLAQVEICRNQVREVFAHLESSGVSVNLVYALECNVKALQRTEILLRSLLPRLDSETDILANRFLGQLIREQLGRRSFLALFRDNLHLISRKVVERTGLSGEHYITRTPREYYQMLVSAAGGGALTVGTTLAKFLIANLKAALFFEGFLASINYAGSFILMQFLGLTLATKQPSMTASTLAGKLRDLEEDGDAEPFVEEFTRIARSQFAAAMGNIVMAIPVAMVVDLGFRAIFHHSILDPHHAHQVSHSFDPIPQSYGTSRGADRRSSLDV